MSKPYWSIDSALQIHPVDSVPTTASPLDRPEQLIDTVLLRNLASLSTIFLGRRAMFLFHSTEYWGPFDLGCILSDGSIGAFENKGRSVAKVGFDKFCRDIRTVKGDPDKYVRQRFDHMMTYIDEYVATAERMFAGFFLGVRCDTQSQSRDLTAEASQLLSVSREQFHSEFRKGNEWLEHIRTCSSLEEYIGGFVSTPASSNIAPVLLVPHTCEEQRVRSWLPDPVNGNAAVAVLGSYRFYGEKKYDGKKNVSAMDVNRVSR
jgi:hypothetical protein